MSKKKFVISKLFFDIYIIILRKYRKEKLINSSQLGVITSKSVEKTNDYVDISNKRDVTNKKTF